MKATSFEIDGKKIGPGQPTYIIAEISANHGSRYDDAVKLVKAAYETGASAVKLQTYTADTLTIPSRKSDFQIKGGTKWDGKTLYELYQEAYTPWEWQPKLKKLADSLGMTLFSSAFDATAVDFLEDMKIPAHKVASFEIVDLPLIAKMAKTGKPLIISTGMATQDEIREAVDTAEKNGAGGIALLKCTSAYPAPFEAMNLRTIPDLMKQFRFPIGISDHSLGITVPIAAVTLGATIIEKHFTLDRKIPGPDSSFSLEPKEFRAMVDSVREVEKSLGKPSYGPEVHEKASLIFRRSLYIVKPVKKGEKFTSENVRSIRPGYGLPPKHLEDLLKGSAAQDLEPGTPTRWQDVVLKSSTKKRKAA